MEKMWLAERGFGSEWEWWCFPGSWMSHQRYAGCLGRKAEFPCGLPGKNGSRRFAVDLEVSCCGNAVAPG